jgi:hypothetical protein
MNRRSPEAETEALRACDALNDTINAHDLEGHARILNFPAYPRRQWTRYHLGEPRPTARNLSPAHRAAARARMAPQHHGPEGRGPQRAGHRAHGRAVYALDG